MEPFQLFFALAFCVILAVLLWWNRRRVIVEWLVYPLVYFAMYRSSWGLNAMDRLASAWRRPLQWVGVAAIALGFMGMGLISYQLVKNLVAIVAKEPGAVAVGIVQPFAQNVPGTIFVPFVYFAISIFVIAVLHEFSHGVMARVHQCKVRSSGFAFLGVLLPIIPAAFVEPDEKEMSRKSPQAQMSILAAGAVSNIILALALLGLIVYGVQPLTESLIHPLGVEIVTVSKASPAEISGLKAGELITALDGNPVSDSKQLLSLLKLKAPGQSLEVLTNVSAHQVLLQESPSKPGKPFFGVQVINKFEISKQVKDRFGTALPEFLLWLAGLLFWVFNLSLGIGLFNLVPLGPIDGGKMFQLGLSTWFEQKTAHRIWMIVSIGFLSAILFNLGAAFFA